MLVIIFFILGLIVGSFLNVLVYRLHSAEKLFWDRSRCPSCKHIIRWYDNMPVLSFILLRGHCRDCKKRISWQYPLVEISTGFIFAAIGYAFFNLNILNTWLVTTYYLIISGALITILVYDWLYLEIPAVVIWVALSLSVTFNLLFDWFQTKQITSVLDVTTYSGVLAGFLAFLFFFILVAGSDEKWMGMGDAYLVLFLGFVLGWPKLLLALFLAFSLGAIYGIIMIILGKRKMKSQVPFAPFLVLGTFIALFFYLPITSWYFSLIIG